MISYSDFLLETKKEKGIIVYHLSDELSHLKRCDFRLDLASDVALFGKAIYFSTSLNIRLTGSDKYFGCKYLIYPDEPMLNMNDKLSQKNAKILLDDFNTMFKTNVRKDILDRVYCYGDFFEQAGGSLWEINNKYFKPFIQEHLGFNSFKYYQTEYTDFRHSKGDYGICYGLYNPKSIKFVDGPF
jgi:hypothetical protein